MNVTYVHGMLSGYIVLCSLVTYEIFGMKRKSLTILRVFTTCNTSQIIKCAICCIEVHVSIPVVCLERDLMAMYNFYSMQCVCLTFSFTCTVYRAFEQKISMYD